MTREKVYYWPLWFSRLLSSQQQKKIKKLLPRLQRAQIFLWRALNIYDDFLDGDGRPADLPLANSYLRRYLDIHYRLKLPADYYRLMDRLFKRLDKANLDEINNPALKNNPKNMLSALADKSLVLGLGAFAILSGLGYKQTDKKMRNAISLFKYLLAAKQLADDSLDWLEDLKRGAITPANRPIIRAVEKRKIKLDLDKKPEIANLLFCRYSSPWIISQLKIFCEAGRKELTKFNSGQNNPIARHFIRPQELACERAEKFLALIVENQQTMI